jgi:hypothetical protein
MKEIVIINQWSSYLTKDIVNEFVKRNFKTVLITGNLSESGVEVDPNVHIHRILKYNKKNKIKRLFSWGVGTLQILFLLWFKYRRQYLVFTSNPPTSAFISSVIKNRFSIQILDIYPDALIAGKFIKPGSFIHKKWVAINKKSFAKADYIFTLTDGMKDTISQYVEAGKIISIHQWPTSGPIERIPKASNPFVIKYSLLDSFVVMYSGNMGLGHHVDILVEVANELKSEKNIVFFFIGEGWLKETIQQKINFYGLSNCVILPFQSAEMFKFSIQAADIGVVTVTKEMAHLSVPIKTYNLINNFVPLLCITEGKSELSALTTKFRIGESFLPTEIKGISSFILTLKLEREKYLEYQKNLMACSKVFSNENAKQYVDLIDPITYSY